MPRSSLFWDIIAKRYSRQPVANEAAYQQKLQETRQYLKPEMEVLEFGCGTGTTALIHAPHVKHILATDVSRKMLDIARDKAKTAGITNVTFEQADITDLEVADDTYDVIMGHSILHLLPNKEAVIAKAHRMLKPGGIFVSSTTCMGHLNPILKMIIAIGRTLGLLPPIQLISVDELAGHIRDAGFTIGQQWQPSPDEAVFIIATK